MDPWARRRQTIILGIAAFAALGIAAFVYINYQPAPSCSDGLQNQGERAADCGGPCAAVCVQELRPLVVEWARVFPIAGGLYDVVARVSNPNETIGAALLHYTFELFDSENLSITRRTQSTFVNPNESFYIFESLIPAGARIPVRAIITLGEPHKWMRFEGRIPKLSIIGKNYRNEPTPLATAELVNGTLETLRDVRAIVVLYDEEGIAYGASATLVKSIGKDGRAPLSFTWPAPFAVEPARIDMQSRVSVWEEAPAP